MAYQQKRNNFDADSPEFRVKLPKDNEVFGMLVTRLGGSRSNVRCSDGKERITRIPGRLRKRLWVREGDIVIVEPWEFGGDKKGDIVYKYRPVQAKWLKDNNYLDWLEDEDEF
jgi:translation initiation factor 1A